MIWPNYNRTRVTSVVNITTCGVGSVLHTGVIATKVLNTLIQPVFENAYTFN